jgi:hypothetical protein
VEAFLIEVGRSSCSVEFRHDAGLSTEVRSYNLTQAETAAELRLRIRQDRQILDNEENSSRHNQLKALIGQEIT